SGGRPEATASDAAPPRPICRLGGSRGTRKSPLFGRPERLAGAPLPPFPLGPATQHERRDEAHQRDPEQPFTQRFGKVPVERIKQNEHPDRYQNGTGRAEHLVQVSPASPQSPVNRGTQSQHTQQQDPVPDDNPVPPAHNHSRPRVSPVRVRK